MVLVREADRAETVPQLREHAAGVREGGLLPEDADVPFHQLLHLDPDPGDGLLAALAAEQPIEDPGLFLPEGLPGRRAPRVARSLLRELRRGESAGGSEDEALAQAVRSQSVRPVDGDAGRLADRVEAGERRLALQARRHAAHDVVLSRPDRDQFMDGIEAHVLLRELADHRDPLVDPLLAEVPQVQAEVRPVGSLERTACLDLLNHRPREDVARTELHLAGQVALHVALPLLVHEAATFAAGRLRDRDAGPRAARRTEWDHPHVLE